ncbi:hypothetical protein RI543_003424 [Arxiozyma heterogenica]|uniref:Uncharacterized protein n=1 Tax=Arxiozyma heterogenica TaxID=278026 RepID=A0AAN7WST1_9SACH|nr:hypothetical protein RI543_003424 [Kazachstania heterogenica]
MFDLNNSHKYNIQKRKLFEHPQNNFTNLKVYSAFFNKLGNTKLRKYEIILKQFN